MSPTGYSCHPPKSMPALGFGESLMQSRNAVEVADRNSRVRAYVMAAAGLAFLLIHVVFRSYVGMGAETAEVLTRRVMWVVNVVVLLLGLSTGGGLLNNRE